LTELFILLEKQLKQLPASMNGLLKRVTLHKNKSMKDANKVTHFIQKLVPNKACLSIEELSPIYNKSLGTNQAYLLSALI
jgi:hypothetical protein